MNENFPEPLTPFLYSIAREGYYHYFRNLGIAIGLKPADVQSVDHQLRHAIGTHGGRMYYNLTNIGDALRAAPLGDQLCRAFGRFVGTPESDLNTPGDGAKRFPVRDLLRIARRSSVLTFRVGSLLTEFESTIDEFAGRSDPDGLSELRLDQLHALLLEFVDIRCHRWLGGSLADSSTVIHYALLRRWLLRVYPETEVLKIQNSLLKALPGVVSSHPIEGLWKLATRVRSDPEMIRLFERRSAVQVLEEIESESRFAAFRTLFREYLEQYGFRCSGELLLTVPSFQEEPEKLISILQAYVRSDGRSPVDVMAEQASARELETTEVVATLRSRGRFKWLPWPRVSTGFRSFLTRTQQAISYRERARLKQSLLYSRLRRIVLEIGRKLTERDRLDTKEDALYFTWQELDQILTGTEMFPDSMRETVRLRREERSKLGRMQIPDSFRLPAGQYLSADQTTSGMGKGLSAVDSDSLEKSKGVLHGECACGGRVAGRAAVISGVEEFDQLREGDILVAGQTDPGWGPVFCMIGGLVLQRGGMLSHGAILAREFGIPTIVAVDHATKIIQHGDRLELNAGDGCVRIVDSQERVNGGS